MAHFIARIKGTRGEASRLGTKNSGIRASAQGWDIGARIEIHHGASLGANGADIVNVYITGGSNARIPDQHLGAFRIGANGQLEPCTSIGTTK